MLEDLAKDLVKFAKQRILGLEVSVSLARSGFNIKVKSQQKSKVGKNHRISKDDTIKFLTENFGVQVV